MTAFFLHSDVEKGENFYVVIPKVSKQKGRNGNNKVLKLENTIYGPGNIPWYLWNYITDKLEACELDRS